MMAQSVYHLIAADIEANLSADPGYAVPSIKSMALQYNVGTTTVWRAIRFLAAKGLVTQQSTTRIVRAPALGLSENCHLAVDKLYAQMKQFLREGMYRQGDTLPKFAAIAEKFHVAHSTIADAFKRLAEELLIYKEGKRWRAGVSPFSISDLASLHYVEANPTILLLCTDIYQNVFRNFFLQSFVSSLEFALREQKIQFTLVFRKKEMLQSAIPYQGREQIKKYILSLGKFYCGTVIVDQFFETDTFTAWTHFLSQNGTKPVLFFDASDTQKDFVRSKLCVGNWYYRMHFDEKSAVNLALKHLADLGHRIIGVPILRNDWQWVKQRVQLIKKAGRKQDTSLLFITEPLHESFWETTGIIDDRSQPEILSHLMSRFVDAMRIPAENKEVVSARLSPEVVLSNTPSIKSLLAQGATAFICQNDWLAHQIYTWCFMVGIRIPEDLSIISFDNDPITKMFPFSTIDFGFSLLGIRAARILAGTHLVFSDNDGNIPGECSIVNHRSVARLEKSV